MRNERKTRIASYSLSHYKRKCLSAIAAPTPENERKKCWPKLSPSLRFHLVNRTEIRNELSLYDRRSYARLSLSALSLDVIKTKFSVSFGTKSTAAIKSQFISIIRNLRSFGANEFSLTEFFRLRTCATARCFALQIAVINSQCIL